jgi:hypothetical protein
MIAPEAPRDVAAVDAGSLRAVRAGHEDIARLQAIDRFDLQVVRILRAAVDIGGQHRVSPADHAHLRIDRPQVGCHGLVKMAHRIKNVRNDRHVEPIAQYLDQLILIHCRNL